MASDPIDHDPDNYGHSDQWDSARDGNDATDDMHEVGGPKMRGSALDRASMRDGKNYEIDGDDVADDGTEGTPPDVHNAGQSLSTYKTLDLRAMRRGGGEGGMDGIRDRQVPSGNDNTKGMHQGGKKKHR